MIILYIDDIRIGDSMSWAMSSRKWKNWKLTIWLVLGTIIKEKRMSH